jgi:hypothetical protein
LRHKQQRKKTNNTSKITDRFIIDEEQPHHLEAGGGPGILSTERRLIERHDHQIEPQLKAAKGAGCSDFLPELLVKHHHHQSQSIHSSQKRNSSFQGTKFNTHHRYPSRLKTNEDNIYQGGEVGVGTD